jgi:toxin ParE1/3/4
MSLRFRICSPAEVDIAQHAEFLAKQSLPVALRFVDAVQAAIREVCDTPQAGLPCNLLNPTFADVRSWPVRRFPHHRVFYRMSGGEIEVLRVLHTARDLGLIFGSPDPKST